MPSTVTEADCPTAKPAASAAWKGTVSFMLSRSRMSAMGAPRETISPSSTYSLVITPAAAALTVVFFRLSDWFLRSWS